MGLNKIHYIICGTKIPKDEFRERFGNPAESELPGQLVAADGGESEQDHVVLGRIVHKMDRRGDAEETVNLTARWENSITVANTLEEMGIYPEDIHHTGHPQLYAVTSIL